MEHKSSFVNQKYSWLNGGKTYQGPKSNINLDNDSSQTEKEDIDDNDDDSISSGYEITNDIAEIKETNYDHCRNTDNQLKPFSFEKYNKLKLKHKQAKYIRRYYLQKIFINNNPNELSFTFYPLEAKNHKHNMLQLKDIPQYNRVNTYHIIGINNLKISKALLYELNKMINQDNISKREILNEEENESVFLKKKRYFHFGNTINHLIYEKSQNEIDIITNLKQNEANPSNWIDYIKINFKKNKERLNMIMIDHLSKIAFEKTNLYLATFQLRYYSLMNISSANITIFALRVIKGKQLDNEKDRIDFANEYLAYIKKQQSLSITSIRDIYLVLCQLFQFKESSYLDMIFDYICFEWKREQLAFGMAIILSLIEISILHLKQVSYIEYEFYFNSAYPKIGELSTGGGYLNYKSKAIKSIEEINKRSDYIDNYINESDTNVNFREANIDITNNLNKPNSFYNKDMILYSDICDYIFPIKDVNGFINRLLLLISYQDPTAFNSLCSYTRKYMIDINSQLYEYLLRICSFISHNNITNDNNNKTNQIDHFLLTIIFANKRNSIDNKLIKAKELFRKEINQNNISLYYSFMLWLLYFGKISLSDKIMKNILIKTKQNKEEESFVNLIYLQYNTIKAVTGLILLSDLDTIINSINSSYGNMHNYITLLLFCNDSELIINYLSNMPLPTFQSNSAWTDMTEYIYYAILLFELNSMKHIYSFKHSEEFYISLDRLIQQSRWHIDYLTLLIFKKNYIRFLIKFNYDINYTRYLPRHDYWDVLVILSKEAQLQKPELSSSPLSSSLLSQYMYYDDLVYNNYLSFNLIPYSLYSLSYEYFITSFIDNCNHHPLFSDCFYLLFNRIPHNKSVLEKAMKYLTLTHL